MENSSLDDLPEELFASNPLFDNPLSMVQNSATTSQAFHIQHIQHQYEHVHVLHEYHVQRMNRVRDRQLFESYRDVVAALSNLMAQYEAVLAKLQS